MIKRNRPTSDVIQLLGHGRTRADRLFDQVVDGLALGIVTGRFGAGDLLPNEAEFAKEVPVSRSAFREALKYLAAKGLIEAKPRIGTRVRPREDWNLLDPDILRWSLRAGPDARFARDLFELRRTVEPEAARLAALRRSDADLRRIEDALVRMETLKPLSTGAIAADVEFHQRIFEASGNRALACLKSVVATTILWSQDVKRVIGPEEFIGSLRDHRRIYDAIAASDAALAAAQATLLITDALNSTVSALETRRRDSEPPRRLRERR